MHKLTYWWSTVALMVAFDFWPQNFGRGWGPMNVTLSFYECRLSGGETQRWWGHSNPTYCNQICLTFIAVTGSEADKTSAHTCWYLGRAHLCPSHLVTFLLLNFVTNWRSYISLKNFRLQAVYDWLSSKILDWT